MGRYTVQIIEKKSEKAHTLFTLDGPDPFFVIFFLRCVDVKSVSSAVPHTDGKY